MSKRIEYIDIARGIGILLVVLGHNDFALVSAFAHKVIYSFHMPLFFFLSGYFLDPSAPFVVFLKKRFNSLLKPYLFTIFTIYFLSVSFGEMSFDIALRRIAKSLYATGYYIDWVQLWFLPNLFAASMYAFLFFALTRNLNHRTLRWLILLGTLGAAGPFLDSFYPFSFAVFGREYEFFGLPFSLDLILLSGFFFILGGEIRQVSSEKTFDNIFLLIGTGVGMMLLNIFFDARIDFNTRTYESFIINTVEAVVGIVFVLALSRQIELRTNRLASLFKYFGRASLVILILHVPIQDFWGKKVHGVTGDIPFSIWVAFFMGVAGSVLLHELFVRRNPVASFWLGREAELPEPKKEKSSQSRSS
jgi:fucose 4-O-acetylase-like acetyltransferase